MPDAVDGVITITTAEQLAALAVSVNDGNNYRGVTIKLGADLDLSGHNWTPIGKDDNNPFKGTFDGNNSAGYKISNLTVNSGNYVGLFGYVEDGTVQNVTLENVNITGSSLVGGIVGFNVGTVSGCTVSGTVTGSGVEYVGGLVGYHYEGTVSGNTAIVTISGGKYAGGLVGYTNDKVKDNKFYSNKDAVDFDNSFNDVTNNTRYYSLTVLEGVTFTVTGGDTLTDGTNTYYAGGTVTLTPTGELKEGYVFNTGNPFTITANTTVTCIPNPANHYVFGTEGNYTLATADNVASNNYPELVKVYALTLEGVEVTGDNILLIDGNTAYVTAGEVTLAAKTGYTLSQTSVTVSKDTTISATFDTANHYVFGTEGNYTFATAENVASNNYPELKQVYALTLQGVEVTGDNILLIDGNTAYVTAGEVTLAAKTGYTYSGTTSVNVTEDKTITATDVWGVGQGADGSAEKPYLISDVAGLQALADYVNAGNDCEGLNFKLNGNIDLTDVDFAPIGNDSCQFAGTFDGADFKISNLSISSTGDYVGLFGYSDNTVGNVTVTAIFTGDSACVGGLVGYTSGTVSGNKVSGTVNGNGTLGALVGYNDTNDPINDNYYYGNADAVGYQKDSVTVGTNTRLYKLTVPAGVEVSVDNIFTFGGTTYAAGTVTLATKLGVVYSTENSFTITEDTTITATDHWGVSGGANGSANNPYLISDVAGLQLLAAYVNAGNTCAGLTFKLAEDIDLSSFENFTAIGNFTNANNYNPFRGTFDGDNHTISKLKINSTLHYNGLFSYVGKDGTVKNVKLTDVDISGNGTLGALVGQNDGTIENCTVSGKVNGKGQFVGGLVGDNRGTVSGGTVNNVEVNSSSLIVGGLVGYNGGTVTDGTVNGGKVTSSKYDVGGLVGYNSGTVTGGTVNNVEVSGSSHVGGHTGYNLGGTVTGSKVVATVTATFTATETVYSFVGGVVGQNDNSGTVGTAENPNYYHSDKGAVEGADADNNVPIYELTLPDGVTASGALLTYGNKAYVTAGSVTFTGVKTGYVIDGVNVTQDTTITASLDTENHYVLADDTKTLATADNTTDYPDLKQVYALTLPDGVTAEGEIVATADGKIYAAGSVTFTGAKTGYVIDGVNVTQDTTITATVDTANHYVLADDTKTLAIADNTTAYPNLVQVYELTVPDSLKVTGDTVATANGKTYAAGEVTLTAADGYTLKSLNVNGTAFDGGTFTIDSDTAVTATFEDKFGNGGKGVEVGGTTGDFSDNNAVYSITASQENSTLTGNGKNNTVILTGGGENILTGGGGNDTFNFGAGGGIVTDYGIGSTKDSTGKTLSAPLGSDVIKIDGTVSGVYFDRNASSKKSAKFTAVITYDSDDVQGDDTQIIVLQNINKKPTKYGSNPVYQTNDVAAATLKKFFPRQMRRGIFYAAAGIRRRRLKHNQISLIDEVQS